MVLARAMARKVAAGMSRLFCGSAAGCMRECTPEGLEAGKMGSRRVYIARWGIAGHTSTSLLGQPFSPFEQVMQWSARRLDRSVKAGSRSRLYHQYIAVGISLVE